MALVSAGTKRKRADSYHHFPCYLQQLPKEILVVICRMLPKEDHLWLAQANNFFYTLFRALVLPPAANRLYTGPKSFTSSLSRLQFAVNSPAPPSKDILFSALELALISNDAQAADIILKAYPNALRRLTDEHILSVTRHGHLDIMKWLSHNTCRFTRWVSVCAAIKGHLHVLIWLDDQRSQVGLNICSHAARGGHLHVIQWARQRGYEWCKWTCQYAALHGHLPVLQWARQNGCPWDKTAILRRTLAPEMREWVESQPA